MELQHMFTHDDAHRIPEGFTMRESLREKEISKKRIDPIKDMAFLLSTISIFALECQISALIRLVIGSRKKFTRPSLICLSQEIIRPTLIENGLEKVDPIGQIDIMIEPKCIEIQSLDRREE